MEPTFLEVLAKIKQRDQAIYKPDARFFPDVESEEEENQDTVQRKPSKAKPAYLRDVLAQQVR